MTRTDYATIALALLQIIFPVGVIQQFFKEETTKMFGIIELGIWEWSALSLWIAFTLVFITWKTRKQQEKQKEQERKLKQEKELHETVSLIKQTRELFISARERRKKINVLPFSERIINTQYNYKVRVKLIKLGFTLPDIRIEKREGFEEKWIAFLAFVEVIIEERQYKDQLDAWKDFEEGIK